MDKTSQAISAAVQKMYEAWPYPNYNLLIPLRRQEGFASNSLFAQQLLTLNKKCRLETRAHHLLIAGCGDALPAILGHWEPNSYHMHGIDLSASSLSKARLRCILAGRSQTFRQANIEGPAIKLGGPYQHIDAYGVLHHLANPSLGLQHLSEVLAPGGTMRIMVYNSSARSWIFQLRRVLELLGLSPYKNDDLAAAITLLNLLAKKSPRLQHRLQGMGPLLKKSARLVDTFFHEREARLSFGFWLKAFERYGLEPLGLYDRYAELDDLPNPLRQMPRIEDLETRSLDLRFENNLEVYLWKKLKLGHPNLTQPQQHKIPWGLRRRWAPKAWFQYQETKSLNPLIRWQLWQGFLMRLYKGRGPDLDRLLAQIPEPAMQRLARLGVIAPEQVSSLELKQCLDKPLHPFMEAPQLPNAVELSGDRELQRFLVPILIHNRRPLGTLAIIWQRLQRAQS